VSAVQFRPWAPFDSSVRDAPTRIRPIPNHVIGLLTAIYEFKGKEKLYQSQAPEILAALQSNGMIESTESSNRSKTSSRRRNAFERSSAKAPHH
jgi:hypothetical protein